MKQMNRSRIAALALAIIAVAALFVFAGPRRSSSNQKQAGEAVRWTEDFDAALKEAAATGKPVMLDFFATWCMPCKIMDRVTYTDASVIDETKSWISVRIDVDRHAALAERYRIQAVPTIVFLNPDGTERSRLEGFASAGGLEGAMKKVRAALPRKTDSV